MNHIFIMSPKEAFDVIKKRKLHVESKTRFLKGDVAYVYVAPQVNGGRSKLHKDSSEGFLETSQEIGFDSFNKLASGMIVFKYTIGNSIYRGSAVSEKKRYVHEIENVTTVVIPIDWNFETNYVRFDYFVEYANSKIREGVWNEDTKIVVNTIINDILKSHPYKKCIFFKKRNKSIVNLKRLEAFSNLFKDISN